MVEPNNADSLVNKGNALFKLGNYDDSLSTYDLTLEIHPDHFEALTNKAYVLHNLLKFEEALEYYDRSLSIDPNNLGLLNNREAALKHLGIVDVVDSSVATSPTVLESDKDNESANQVSSDEKTELTGTNGGGCLIATATYGTEMAPQVQKLRELRDNKLMHTESGSSFIGTFNSLYYSFSPAVADYERENPTFKELVKISVTPLVSSLSILNHVDLDSATQVLGYGILLILLNLGMYFVAPAILVVAIRRVF
jgi:tetratricopeptide (TPR) repeat protein